VGKVFFSITSDTSLSGPRLPVRLLHPFEHDLSATLDSTGMWVVTLSDPARIDSLRVAPHVPGFRPSITLPLRQEVRGGVCAARAGYRLTRVWKVEVSSKPESLKVEERASGTATSAQTKYTRFESELLWGDRVTIRVFLKDDQTFEEVFDRPALAAPVVRSSHHIADKICQQRRCGNAYVRAARGKLVEKSVEQLVIRLVPP
jgi:hypothetical protein